MAYLLKRAAGWSDKRTGTACMSISRATCTAAEDIVKRLLLLEMGRLIGGDPWQQRIHGRYAAYSTDRKPAEIPGDITKGLMPHRTLNAGQCCLLGQPQVMDDYRRHAKTSFTHRPSQTRELFNLAWTHSLVVSA